MFVSLLRAAPRASARRSVRTVALVLAASFSLTGCSAGSLTNFDFPSFGLVKKSKQEDDARLTTGAGTPPSGERLGNR